MRLAPIAIFAFNRPNHLRKLIESLRLNREFADSQIFIFVDGPRNETESEIVQQVIDIAKNEVSTKNTKVVVRDKNIGLAKSLLSGIDEVLSEYQEVIVLEDDLVVSEFFLKFCNVGLQVYLNDKNIASIQGFTFDINAIPEDFYFLKGADCWGWATWANRWKELNRDGVKLLGEIRERRLTHSFDLEGAYPYTKLLERQSRGEVDSWAILWHASMYLQDRLSLYPRESLVENLGLDGSGTHSGNRGEGPRDLTSFNPQIKYQTPKESKIVRKNMKRLLRKRYSTYAYWSPKKYFSYIRRKMA
jgi:glycosyltransferase involved in cell wall biosynthesis